MAILFACPYCQTETMVDDAYVGQSGPCVMCGRIVTVPGTASTSTARFTAQSTGRSPERGNLLMIIGLIIASLFAGAAVLAMVVLLVAPAVAVAQISARKAKNGDQLRQIAEAIEQYHFEHGTYPPAYIADKSGKPMHSWRVLILPQLGRNDLYQQYNFNQPWDSPTNMTLLTRMPEIYAAPGDDTALTTFETSYLVIVGANTVFPPGGRVRTRNEITDGLSDTVLVVEATESGICWLEPKDLSANSMSYGINDGPSDCIRGKTNDGAMAAFADGKSHFLPADLPIETVEALTTVNKGEQLPGNVFND